MAFEKGRTKTGGRQAGSRNKINVFDQDIIEQAKQVIAEQVAKGDVAAAKLVLSYSLSKPSSYDVGLRAELDDIKVGKAIERMNNPHSLGLG